MASVIIDRPTVTVRLGRWERLGAFRGDIELPLSQVSGVTTVADAWTELRGIRAPGTGVPGVIALGTRRGSFGKDFAAVYGHRPGIVLELSGADFQRIVVSVDDATAAETVAAELRSHLS